MASREAGCLVSIEDPSNTLSRWPAGRIPEPAVRDLVSALHRDLLQALAECAGIRLFVAPWSLQDGDYAAGMAQEHGLDFIDLEPERPLARWDSALCILYNRGHRKILCIDGQVPDVYPEEAQRVLKKLDLYEMVVGREGDDRCWLVGMNAYQEVLERAEIRPDDALHPILEAASQAGVGISVLDTKHDVRPEDGLERLQALAGRPRHERVTGVLATLGLLPARAPGARP